MDARRLVVWISVGVLGFQGSALALDLLHCTLLSVLLAQRLGLERLLPEGPCAKPQRRVDAAVAQGLSVLAGLALGGQAGHP